MSAVRPWASVRPQEPSALPNPQAGYVVARPHGSRPEGSPMGSSNGADWHPTVVNLIVLIMLELIGYGVLRFVLGKVD